MVTGQGAWPGSLGGHPLQAETGLRHLFAEGFSVRGLKMVVL